MSMWVKWREMTENTRDLKDNDGHVITNCKECTWFTPETSEHTDSCHHPKIIETYNKIHNAPLNPSSGVRIVNTLSRKLPRFYVCPLPPASIQLQLKDVLQSD